MIEDLVKLSYFTEIGKAIASASTINAVLSRVMEKIGEIFAPQNWSLLLLDRKRNELYFKVVIGIDAQLLKDVRVPVGQGITGWVAATGQSAIVEDVAKDPRFYDKIDKLTSFSTRSIIAVPVKTDRSLLGVIELINKLDGESFSALELKLLSTIADFAAIAIEKAYYYRALKRIAEIDPLTGIHNRRSFQRVFYREVERCKRYKQPMSLLMMDIDKFKQINDRFGHVAGDKVLKTFAEILEASVRGVDYVVRYGGDEFLVLMPNTNKEAAETVRSRIQAGLDRHNGSGTELPFHVSIGLHSAQPEQAEDLLFGSDIDLYKQKGRKEEKKTFEDLEECFQDILEDEDLDRDKPQPR